MKVSLLGFEFEARFEPTTETLIRYRTWQVRMRPLRCRAIHKPSWTTHQDHPNYRWYCCNVCQDTWLGPKRPGDGEKSPNSV